jgi:hypothetical protein
MRIEYINVYVDTDVDVPISDIMEQLHTDDLIDELSSRAITPEERSKIVHDFGVGLKDNNIPWSVLDDLKLSVIKEAFNKYTLEELESKLK